MKRLIIFILLSITSVSGAQLIIKNSLSGKNSTLEAIEDSGKFLVPISGVCEKLGYRWQWDRFALKLSCTRNSSRFVFTQNNVFCSLNDSIIMLPIAPAMEKGTLFLPIEPLLDLLGSVQGAPLKWDQTHGLLTIYSHQNSILSVLCDKKQNGTLVTMTLADSLPFNYTYFYPNLIFNFFGGTVDTQLIRQASRIGIVDSVFAVQFKQSAQVSLVLCREIEDPIIDYVQDTRTLMVSLRPKKTRAPSYTKPLNVNKPKVDVEGIRTVVIDPGHGGKDPGCIGPDGTKEKDIVLGIGLQLRDLLTKNNAVTVYMTRRTDVFIPLNERTKMANEKKADLFISVHVNAIPGSGSRKETTKGYKIYFLSQAKNEEDKLVAMRENAVIELEDKPQNYGSLQNVLIDLAGNEYLRESQDLCIFLDQRFNSSLKKKIPKLQLGVGQANFWVLNGAYMPSVLIETGFLSNPDEGKLLSTKQMQKEIASAIADALVDFKGKYESGL